MLHERPELVQVLRERGVAFGLAAQPNLMRVLADAQPEQVIAGIMKTAEAGTRAQLREQARQAEQEAARRRELAARQGPLRSRGMSLG